jgi:hypothetical protein
MEEIGVTRDNQPSLTELVLQLSELYFIEGVNIAGPRRASTVFLLQCGEQIHYVAPHVKVFTIKTTI